MSVYKRGEWQHYRFTFHGQHYHKACKTRDAGVADQMMREHRRQLEHQQYDLPDVKKKMKLFKTEVVAYIDRMQPNWSQKTRKMHNTSKLKVLKYFGNMTLSEITAEVIQQYQAKREKNEIKWWEGVVYKSPTGKELKCPVGKVPSNRTINAEVTLVRQLLIANKLWYRMKEGTGLQMLTENEDTGQALSPEDVKKLLNACRMSVSRSLYPMVLLSIHTGVRRGELTKLQWKNVDLKHCFIDIIKSKTKAGKRTVYLNPMAVELIKDWKAKFVALPDHYVFPSEQYSNSKVVHTYPDRSYYNFWRPWDKARRSVGIYPRWHDLRHTCASILSKAGVSRATRKAILGHMSNKMADHYDHSFQQEQQDAVLNIDSYFAGILNQEQKEVIQ